MVLFFAILTTSAYAIDNPKILAGTYTNSSGCEIHVRQYDFTSSLIINRGNFETGPDGVSVPTYASIGFINNETFGEFAKVNNMRNHADGGLNFHVSQDGPITDFDYSAENYGDGGRWHQWRETFSLKMNSEDGKLVSLHWDVRGRVKIPFEPSYDAVANQIACDGLEWSPPTER
jgi:hypothetical protein